MRDHTKLIVFELADEIAMQDVSTCEQKLVEAEKVLGALIRSMRPDRKGRVAGLTAFTPTG